MKINLTVINDKKQQLENHSLLVTNIIQSRRDLQYFMEHHVFAVWDFMSLTKSLQHYIVPSTTLWLPTPTTRTGSARLINSIVLGEESDVDINGSGNISHFDLYRQAMFEVGADISKIDAFIETVRTQGIDAGLESTDIPKISADFTRSTFGYIDTQKPHVVAAAFAFGRENVIPNMFKGLLKQLRIGQLDAPRFYYYLERHIEVDGDDHGPASLELVTELCQNDPIKIIEAENAAISAIEHRIKFWDKLEILLS